MTALTIDEIIEKMALTTNRTVPGYGELTSDRYTIITPGYRYVRRHIRSAKRARIYRKKHPCKGEGGIA